MRVRRSAATLGTAFALAAGATFGVVEPASALPDANVTWSSPTTFKMGTQAAIYPKLKFYIASSFGDSNEQDMFYGTVRIVRTPSGKQVFNTTMTRVTANHTITITPTLKATGGYALTVKGQMREDTTDCGTSEDCTKKVANVSRRFSFTVKK